MDETASGCQGIHNQRTIAAREPRAHIHKSPGTVPKGKATPPRGYLRTVACSDSSRFWIASNRTLRTWEALSVSRQGFSFDQNPRLARRGRGSDGRGRRSNCPGLVCYRLQPTACRRPVNKVANPPGGDPPVSRTFLYKAQGVEPPNRKMLNIPNPQTKKKSRHPRTQTVLEERDFVTLWLRTAYRLQPAHYRVIELANPRGVTPPYLAHSYTRPWGSNPKSEEEC